MIFYKFYIFILEEEIRYQRGNQNSYIEEEQKTQWPNEKVQKDKQRYTTDTTMFIGCLIRREKIQ